jgi:hypothetical protein
MCPRRYLPAIFACVLLCGCLRPAMERPDVPEPTPEQHAARSAVTAYANALAASFEDAAAKLDDGSLQTAAETNAQLQAANRQARQQAFGPVNELLNDRLGGDRWDVAKAKDVFRNLAEGLKEPRMKSAAR